MSEYQYYEFLAMDRPLSDQEMIDLNSVSSRAEITSTRFSVTYNYSDLRADPIELLGRHYDVFVYVANWGTHRVAFRLPDGVVDPDLLEHYLEGEQAMARRVGEHLIIDIQSEDEEGDWEEGEGWIARLAPVRNEILSGDLRALYLVWLFSVQETYEEELNLEELEPPVPPGMAELAGAQRTLIDFLRLDEHLVDAAAEASEKAADLQNGLAGWISALPVQEKDQFLLSVSEGAGARVGASLLRRYRRELERTNPAPQGQRRSVGDLLEAAEKRRKEAKNRQQRRLAAERKRQEARARKAREKRLDALVGREAETWKIVRRLVEVRQKKAYAEAVALMVDLRDLAEREDTRGQYTIRLAEIRKTHARKTSFISRIQEANLLE